MSDIIFFDTGDVNRDLDRLSSDMQKLADHDISEISVQTIFDELGVYDIQVTNRVNEFLNINTQYHKGFEREDSESDFADATGHKVRKEDKIYKKEIDWNEMSSQDIHLDGLWTNPQMIYAANFNVLGIGSYKNHKYTFSRIEDKLEYVEDGDTYTPKWLCTYDKKDWPFKKLVNDFYSELERTIGDPPDGIDFTFATEVVQYDEDDSKKKRVERKLKVFYRWMKGPPDDPLKNVEVYVAKMDKIFDNLRTLH